MITLTPWRRRPIRMVEGLPRLLAASAYFPGVSVSGRHLARQDDREPFGHSGPLADRSGQGEAGFDALTAACDQRIQAPAAGCLRQVACLPTECVFGPVR